MSSIGNASWELQKGMVGALRADSALTALLASYRPTATDTGIYDEVPQGARLPYIVVGEGTETQAATFGEDGRQFAAGVEVWTEDSESTSSTSGAAGYKQGLAIKALVEAVILDGTVTLGGSLTATVLGVAIVEKERNDESPPYLRSVVPTFDILVEPS